MKQIITLALAATILSCSSTIAAAQQQSENRLKAVSIEVYESGSGAYVPNDSIKYNWATGEGTSNFRNFPNSYWGWYLQDPVPVYNPTGTIIKSDQQMQYIWNDATNQFDEAFKTVLTLNAGGVVTEEIVYKNDAENWKQYSKTTFVYQSDQLVLTEIHQSPDGINWENAAKAAFSYYASGDLKTYITYEGLINNQWLPLENKSFIYAGGLRTQETTVKWDDITDDWETHPYFRYDYTYNSNDLCDTVTYSQWGMITPSALGEWQKTFYKYNTNGFITELQINDRNNGTRTWQKTYKKTYTYNYSYPMEATSYRWNDQSSAFDNDVRHQFTFNGELLSKIEAQKWDDVSGSWAPNPHTYFGRQTTFYYEQIDEETGIDKVAQQMNFKVYPNPATDKITVELENSLIRHIRITNITGQTIFRSKGVLNASSFTVPVGHLAPGVYFLSLESPDGKAVKTLVLD